MQGDKVREAISKQIEPLYEEWRSLADWTAEEEFVFFHKVFDANKPTDADIQKMMSVRFGRHYLFYHSRKINRIFNSAKRKVFKIIP